MLSLASAPLCKLYLLPNAGGTFKADVQENGFAEGFDMLASMYQHPLFWHILDLMHLFGSNQMSLYRSFTVFIHSASASLGTTLAVVFKCVVLMRTVSMWDWS